MRAPPLILIADDNPTNVDILKTRLSTHGYEIVTASNGEEALAVANERLPDLILLDIMMPKLDGIEVCRRLKTDTSLPFMPVIIVTARGDSKDVVAGLDAGGDEYLTKPVDGASLVARVKSMLRAKALHDKVQEQAARLAQQAAELTQWNETLAEKVGEQVAQLERLGRLKRFFSPSLADAIVSGGAEDPLRSHRRQIVVVFLDLRGFTAFAETAEPEEVMGVLREYHAAMGELILAHEGTLERFTGDGLMVFFNDPVIVSNPQERAIRMALAMRERIDALTERWRKLEYELDFGIGIAEGYATIGAIGFEGRWDYGAIGSVTNMAARLCAEARPGQIIITRKLLTSVEGMIEAVPVGELTLKGFSRPVSAYNVLKALGT